jgi:ubiquinone/menaquinone biosynthesis C-methylase UbiE
VSSDRYRLSFDTVADAYERGRPPYARAALAWIAERLDLSRVLDLGAGTGKLTRQLVALGAEVVAVEPGAEMRAVFQRLLPDVEILAGSAEAIPLPAASVDAVTAGEAFHWFRTEQALAEIHRVLRPHGGVALLWKPWDEEDPVLRAVNAIVRERSQRPLPEDWRKRFDPALFGPIVEAAFREPCELTADQLVDWVASTSTIATASAADRAAVESEVRAVVGSGRIVVSVPTEVAVFERA